MMQSLHLPTLRSLLSSVDQPFIHRDLSWLQFNERVLSEAREPSNPLLERLKFLAISFSNLDEFFMIRYASLEKSLTKLHRQQKLDEFERLKLVKNHIWKRVEQLQRLQSEAFSHLVLELEAAGIDVNCRGHRDPSLAEMGKKIFLESIAGHLESPRAMGVRDLKSLRNLRLAVLFRSGQWLKVPKTLAPMYVGENPLNGRAVLFFLDDLLCQFAGEYFGISPAHLVVRLTRDGDFTIDPEEVDGEISPELIRAGIKRREMGKPLRLQFRLEPGALGEPAAIDQKVSEKLSSAFRLPKHAKVRVEHTLCLHGLWSAVSQLPQSFKEDRKFSHHPAISRIPVPFRGDYPIFKRLDQRDFLLHHPYDSFESFVSWISGACADPHVESIDIAVYRMDSMSPIIEHLKQVARTKKVRVAIELRARFDEMNNIRLAEDLRNSGVEVGFGFGNLKLHAKLALVTRVLDGVKKNYTHLSTGNYNSSTARQYTDLAILTSSEEIGEDARNFFDSVHNGVVPKNLKKLILAPTQLHRRLRHLIEAETAAAKVGKSARIFVKVNALVDEGIIQSLYEASQAGVRVDLLVRGACSLIPGVKGLSENIRVISIVDRYLEHSRIYFFESSATLYLSSADWMPRNFYSRLEIAFPVLDPRIYSYIKDLVIPIYLSDSVKARELTSVGTWKSVKKVEEAVMPSHDFALIPPEARSRSQFYFERLAETEYKGTQLHYDETIASDPTRPSG